ncbi:unnamed protein product [Calicophoron daubneyi]|uniref:Protein HIRA n=2 Tax=Calicophoron daubneyi TaxID=300641 RepID=A0AAV2T1W8_CALDB
MRLLKPLWITHGSLSKDNSIDRPIYSLDIHPDGSRLATGGVIDTCGVVILWNMVPIRNPKLESDEGVPKKLFQMDSHQACVNCVRWSPTGRWLASAGMDKVVMIWKKTALCILSNSEGAHQTTVFGVKGQTKFTEHWRCASVLRGHAGDIIDLAWSHDGQKLASASVDNNVIVWCRQPPTSGHNMGHFALLATLKGHQGFVKGVAWDPIGRYLASQSDEVAVIVWRTADWQQEAIVKKPFTKAGGQSQVMRISWSLDGSTLAAPHAINNGFPTAKLISRTNWVPGLDLVGHRKHVICARYNPNVFRRPDKGETQSMVCLALGSKDRSVSVWTTAGRRARVVIHDLFTNSVCDLTWSSNGKELMACSLDGTVSYMGFSTAELGTPWPAVDVVRLHHSCYGQSLLEHLDQTDEEPSGLSKGMTSVTRRWDGNSANQSDIVLETPEALALQQSRIVVCQRLKNVPSSSPAVSELPPHGPTEQIETRGKDGRRRIIPKFLGRLDSIDEDTNSNPQFCPSRLSPTASQTFDSLTTSSISVASPAKSGNPIANTNTVTAPRSAGNAPKSTLDKNHSNCKTSSPAATRMPIQEAVRAECGLINTPDKSELLAKTNAAQEYGIPSKLTSVLSPPVVTVTVNAPLSAKSSDVDICVPGQKRRGSVILDGALSEDESTKKAASKARKKRRVRLFVSSDENSASSPVEKKFGAHGAKVLSTASSEVMHPEAALKSRMVTLAEDNVPTESTNSRAIGSTDQPFLIDTPDQLASVSKIQFVCSHPVYGPVLVELTGNAAASTTHSINNVPVPQNTPTGIRRITASRNDRRLWELVSESRLTSYAYTDNLILFGDCSGRIQLLSSNGGRVCAPIVLDSAVHLLSLLPLDDTDISVGSTSKASFKSMPSVPTTPIALSRLHTVVSGGEPRPNNFAWSPSCQNKERSNYRITALCKSGKLLIWRLSPCTEGICSAPSFIAPPACLQLVLETDLHDVVKAPGSALGFCSIMFTSEGYPVVHRRNGSSYLFDTEARVWFELFDACNGSRCNAALMAARSCPSGPLASCQMLRKSLEIQAMASNPSRSEKSSADQRLIIQHFLEAQTHNARMFGSAAEYRFWITRWFRHLIEDNEEEQLRHICQDLIGPTFVGSRTSWEPLVKGLSKHELLRELLTLFALNLSLQRLYVEMKEMLDQRQDEDTRCI